MIDIRPGNGIYTEKQREENSMDNGAVHDDQDNRDALYFPLQTNATIHSSFFATLLLIVWGGFG
jgi:hypothetical protein